MAPGPTTPSQAQNDFKPLLNVLGVVVRLASWVRLKRITMLAWAAANSPPMATTIQPLENGRRSRLLVKMLVNLVSATTLTTPVSVATSALVGALVWASSHSPNLDARKAPIPPRVSMATGPTTP